MSKRLGHKFNKSTKTLGHKMDKMMHRLGNKVNNALAKGDSTMRKIDNTVNDLNKSGMGALPVVGTGVRIGAVGAHLAHKATSHAKSKDLEKYNKRKQLMDKMSDDGHTSFI